MARKHVIVTSAALLCAAALGPVTGQADDPAVPVAGVSLASAVAAVPLPVARPAWILRTAGSNAVSPKQPAESGAGTGAALKSGSTEALVVQFEGAKVQSAEGNVIGEVERVVEGQGGNRYAVVGVGGFLGIGENRVLVPADSLSPSDKGMVRSELTEEQILGLPAYPD